jgi:hypothetical protein
VSEPTYLEAPPAVLAIHDELRGFAQLATRLGGAGRVVLRKPADTTSPWVWTRSAGGFPLNAELGGWSRTVQVEVCATAPVGEAQELPELFVERVAGLIATHLASIRAQVFQGASWRPHVLDGPFDLTDTSRGDDAPVFKQAVRLDVRMHAHV